MLYFFIKRRLVKHCWKLTSSRRLQDVFKTSLRHVCKKSSSWCLQDVFKKTSCNYVLKSSWRRLGRLKIFYTEYIFSTSSPRRKFAGQFLYSTYITLSIELGPHWYKIGNKACYIPKVDKFYVEKEYLLQQAWKYHLWHVNMYFTD